MRSLAPVLIILVLGCGGEESGYEDPESPGVDVETFSDSVAADESNPSTVDASSSQPSTE